MKNKINSFISRRTFLLGSVVILFSSLPIIKKLHASPKRIKKVALGSCITQDRKQPIWKSILKEKSDLFVFMGDNVYGDDKKTGKLKKLKKAYNKQKTNIPFTELKKTNEIFAIWDDHDYGKNDGGAEYPYKKEAKELFLDFWGAPKNDSRRQRDGIYFETKRLTNEGIVQFIFLDTRYFRSPLKRTDEWGAPTKERYLPDNNPSKTFLGDDQWIWLSNVLSEDADIRIIVSSIQIIAEGHGYEKWGNLPLEKNKLYDLIDNKGIKNMIFISGDRHAGGIYKDRTKSGNSVYEITSSSLNLPGGAWISKYKGKKRPPEAGPNRVNSLYLWENYGLIEFKNNKEILLSLKDIDGKTVNKIQVNF